jgi:ELWxxDGT repeat protein
LLNVGGLLYFVADDGATGFEPWRSNQATAGTVRIKDIRAGALGSEPKYLTNISGIVHFAADDGINGSELWRANISGPATVLVADIQSGAGTSNPAYLLNAAGVLYFSADNGTNGRELWTLKNPIPADSPPFQTSSNHQSESQSQNLLIPLAITQKRFLLDAAIAEISQASASFISDQEAFTAEQKIRSGTALEKRSLLLRSKATRIELDRFMDSFEGEFPIEASDDWAITRLAFAIE